MLAPVPEANACSTALGSRSLDTGQAAAGRNVKQCECQIAATSSQGKVPGHRPKGKNEATENDAAERRGSE
jgi:hypothetical protein